MSRTLRNWHIAIGVIDLILALVIIGVAIGVPAARLSLPLFTDYAGIHVFLFNLEVIWFLAAATIIGGIVHLYYALARRTWHRYYESIINYKYESDGSVFARHVNPMRWALYSIIYPLIFWPLAHVSGITNVYLLVALTVMSAILAYAAFHLEAANRNVFKSRNITLAPIWLGGLVWLTIWVIVFIYLGFGSTLVAFPWYVWTAVVIAFILGISIGCISLLRYTRYSKMWRSDWMVERAYLCNEIIYTVLVVSVLLIGAATT